jgi:hypothetical protein
VRARAEAEGLRVVHPDLPPDGVTVVKGEWPGVRLSRGGGDAAAGPTGAPWVDSNGWRVRLAKAMKPGAEVWVAAATPRGAFRLRTGAYLTAVADTAAYGGRWIVEIEDDLAAELCDSKGEAIWKTIADAGGFFAAHAEWESWQPAALVGVISDFSGENEFFSGELLNLLARAGLHFVVWPKDRVPEMRGVRAVIYADQQPPSDELRRRLKAFGGVVIEGQGDPFEVAQDAAVKISHRYDQVRCWNAGAFGSYMATSLGGRKAVVHLLFYADRGPNEASVRIAGPWREAKGTMVNVPSASVDVVRQKDAIEVHLPQVGQYVALELTA